MEKQSNVCEGIPSKHLQIVFRLLPLRERYFRVTSYIKGWYNG